MYEEENTQPRLTSHEVRPRTGPSRGKQVYDVQRHQKGNGSTRLADNRPQKPRPPKQKREGFNHEELLSAFRGVELNITLIDGANFRGKLVDCDRYTLVISEAGGSRRIIFKGALSDIELPKVS